MPSGSLCALVLYHMLLFSFLSCPLHLPDSANKRPVFRKDGTKTLILSWCLRAGYSGPVPQGSFDPCTAIHCSWVPVWLSIPVYDAVDVDQPQEGMTAQPPNSIFAGRQLTLSTCLTTTPCSSVKTSNTRTDAAARMIFLWLGDATDSCGELTRPWFTTLGILAISLVGCE